MKEVLEHMLETTTTTKTIKPTTAFNENDMITTIFVYYKVYRDYIIK
jgi:hypothetical protein